MSINLQRKYGFDILIRIVLFLLGIFSLLYSLCYIVPDIVDLISLSYRFRPSSMHGLAAFSASLYLMKKATCRKDRYGHSDSRFDSR